MSYLSNEIQNLILKYFIISDAENVYFNDPVSQSTVVSLKISEYNGTFFGFIYEKLVGQYYENLGYQVQYIGLTKGVADGGIDLIAEQDEVIYFIQCKHSFKKKMFSQNSVGKMLYEISKSIEKQNKKSIALIVVPKKENFFKRVSLPTSKIVPKYHYPIDDFLALLPFKAEIVEVPSSLIK